MGAPKSTGEIYSFFPFSNNLRSVSSKQSPEHNIAGVRTHKYM